VGSEWNEGNPEWGSEAFENVGEECFLDLALGFRGEAFLLNIHWLSCW